MYHQFNNNIFKAKLKDNERNMYITEVRNSRKEKVSANTQKSLPCGTVWSAP